MALLSKSSTIYTENIYLDIRTHLPLSNGVLHWVASLVSTPTYEQKTSEIHL